MTIYKEKVLKVDLLIYIPTVALGVDTVAIGMFDPIFGGQLFFRIVLALFYIVSAIAMLTFRRVIINPDAGTLNVKRAFNGMKYTLAKIRAVEIHRNRNNDVRYIVVREGKYNKIRLYVKNYQSFIDDLGSVCDPFEVTEILPKNAADRKRS